MKRFFTLLLLFASTLNVLAQTPANSRRPLWVGLDMGGTWQASDMKGLGGIGWSFTISRYSKLDKTGPLYFGWRGRFLDGRNYGYSYHALTTPQLLADPTLSTLNSPLDYAHTQGNAYANYRMRFDEFAYEIIIGSNGLRKHGVLLYGFGGIGLTHWKTTINQLDNSGSRFDYSNISMTGNDDLVRTDLRNLWSASDFNSDYETLANGSKSSGQWNFMPSAGIGFGYQWTNAVALGVEHRTTWALNDLIDGVNHDGAGAKTLHNDIYNYDGLFVRWTFGGNGNSNSNTTNNTNVPANPNNTVHNNPVPPNNNTTPVVTPTNNNTPTNNTTPQSGTPPTVRFTTPSVEPYNATVVNQQLVVRVEHVSSSNNISLVINNQVSTMFSFNPSTNTMVFSHTLQNGVNTYQVTGTNQYGSASDVQTIYFKVGDNTNGSPSLPPTVNITNPNVDPYTSTTQTMNVYATVLNVTSASGILVRMNGNPVNNFSFDPNAHQVSFLASLQTGSNLYEVIGTNSVGSASDHTTINYNPVAVIQPPVVTIVTPASCPFSVKIPAYTVTAKVTNVTTASQVSVVFNNQAVNGFTFTNMGSYANVSFNVTLNAGTNPFSITGTNAGGSDTKSCQLILKVTAPTPVVPPTVNITTPSSSPYASGLQSYTVIATVLNVNSQSEISVTKNNASVNSWTYNMNTHILTLPTVLNTGSNTFVISATNANGHDSKTAVVTYQPVSTDPGGTRDPVLTATITPTDPGNNGGPQDPNAAAGPAIQLGAPATQSSSSSTASLPVTMTVTGVSQISEISVRVNSVVLTTATYNAFTHLLSFNVNLATGTNTIEVRAQNVNGLATTSLTVSYAPAQMQRGGNSSSGNKGNSTTPSNSTTKPRTAETKPAAKPVAKPEDKPAPRAAATTTTTKPKPTSTTTTTKTPEATKPR